MKILMIRHGRTNGNLEHRYIGSTNESLSSGEWRRLSGKRKKLNRILEEKRPVLFLSPMKRCLETAEILLGPNAEFFIIPDFREIDFGEFEYRTYRELTEDPATKEAYQAYIDSNGNAAFPGGESRRQFEDRVDSAAEMIFRKLLQKESTGDENGKIMPVFIVHGGTIMAILDEFSSPHGDYFRWQTDPGSGYMADLVTEDGKIRITHITSII